MCPMHGCRKDQVVAIRARSDGCHRRTDKGLTQGSGGTRRRGLCRDRAVPCGTANLRREMHGRWAPRARSGRKILHGRVRHAAGGGAVSVGELALHFGQEGVEACEDALEHVVAVALVVGELVLRGHERTMRADGLDIARTVHQIQHLGLVRARRRDIPLQHLEQNALLTCVQGQLQEPFGRVRLLHAQFKQMRQQHRAHVRFGLRARRVKGLRDVPAVNENLHVQLHVLHRCKAWALDLYQRQRHVAVALFVQRAEHQQILVRDERCVGEKILEQHAVARSHIGFEEAVVDVPEHTHRSRHCRCQIKCIRKLIGVRQSAAILEAVGSARGHA
eukprot:m.1443515 g.1443515  ORF g.1443515 m.1443515 type:complete len:333 (+) comp25102_c1_seq2:2412-3410(+)